MSKRYRNRVSLGVVNGNDGVREQVRELGASLEFIMEIFGDLCRTDVGALLSHRIFGPEH